MLKTKSLISSIRSRRSVRSFIEKPIDRKTIEELLISAMYAPSAKNKQPWSFIVCTGRTKDKIFQSFYDSIEKNVVDKEFPPKWLAMAKDTAMLIKEAPVLVLICYEHKQITKSKNDGDLWQIQCPQCECCDIQSIGASVQNLILEAHNLGISSLWVCDILYAYDEIANIVNPNGTILAGVLLGYSKTNPKTPERDFCKVKWLE